MTLPQRFVMATLFAFAMAPMSSARPRQATDQGSVTDVSMISLIANPERFDGKRVRLIGAMRIAFERNALYLHREDMQHHVPMNAVWLSFSAAGATEPQRALSGEYVVVEGTFNSQFKGHWGRYAGAIQAITRIAKWAPPEGGAVRSPNGT